MAVPSEEESCLYLSPLIFPGDQSTHTALFPWMLYFYASVQLAKLTLLLGTVWDAYIHDDVSELL